MPFHGRNIQQFGKKIDMRIIKEGKLPPKEKEMTCQECGCVFMYERSDVVCDERYGCYVVCPTCGKFITINW